MMRKAKEAAAAAGNAEMEQRETNRDIALRRHGKPEEVAALVAFLLSDDSSYITGNSISIDGGWHC